MVHPWEFDDKHTFANGKNVPTDPQAYDNNQSDFKIDANFMNYTSKAADFWETVPGYTRNAMTKYFNENVGKATRGQIQQVINNYFEGNLNFNDIKKKK